MLGLKSKINKIIVLKKELKQLENSSRLHICFGSKKLFNAQYHLKENGYNSHAEWLADWQKKRGGRFYCIGKSVAGGGTMIKVSHQGGEDFIATVTLPRFMQNEHGQVLKIPFVVNEDRRGRKSSLIYALQNQKPITIQVFRREHKKNQWYIHLTTYIQEIPITTSRNNGCIGVDFNRDSIEWAYISQDGNLQDIGSIDYKWEGFSSGHRLVMMRNLVVKLSQLAFNYQCPIAIESLDFGKKKASMSEASKAYNYMLSNLSTGMFRETLESRCIRFGIELIKVNPAFTSVIGMIKFMGRYGLNSGTAAAMTIARRAMGHSERSPLCLVRPEERAKHPWTTWNRVARFLKKNKIRRSQLYDWTKALEKILVSSDVSNNGDINEMTSSLSSALLPIES